MAEEFEKLAQDDGPVEPGKLARDEGDVEAHKLAQDEPGGDREKLAQDEDDVEAHGPGTPMSGEPHEPPE